MVARASDLPPGSRIIVEVAGRSVGVFNVDGQLYAFLNNCPHQGAELCRGDIVSDVVAPRPGEWSVASPAKFLTCPWDGWEFDLETGRSWFDPSRTNARTFPAGYGRRPGPYRADTLDVDVDGDHVVVEMGR